MHEKYNKPSEKRAPIYLDMNQLNLHNKSRVEKFFQLRVFINYGNGNKEKE
jgi:hypothetical protein